jgi:hypothetical protein
MFWKRRKPGWFVDPAKVRFGSVLDHTNQNLSRSHVRVKYDHEHEARFVPLVDFISRCREAIRVGRSLGIEHLLVAPIVKQRHASFFDCLTDWAPAMRRASVTPARRRRPEARV